MKYNKEKLINQPFIEKSKSGYISILESFNHSIKITTQLYISDDNHNHPTMVVEDTPCGKTACYVAEIMVVMVVEDTPCDKTACYVAEIMVVEDTPCDNTACYVVEIMVVVVDCQLKMM